MKHITKVFLVVSGVGLFYLLLKGIYNRFLSELKTNPNEDLSNPSFLLLGSMKTESLNNDEDNARLEFLNNASKEELKTLPGVCDVIANRVIQIRPIQSLEHVDTLGLLPK